MSEGKQWSEENEIQSYGHGRSPRLPEHVPFPERQACQHGQAALSPSLLAHADWASDEWKSVGLALKAL